MAKRKSKFKLKLDPISDENRVKFEALLAKGKQKPIADLDRKYQALSERTVFDDDLKL